MEVPNRVLVPNLVYLRHWNEFEAASNLIFISLFRCATPPSPLALHQQGSRWTFHLTEPIMNARPKIHTNTRGRQNSPPPPPAGLISARLLNAGVLARSFVRSPPHKVRF